jgi:hypothetical protein
MKVRPVLLGVVAPIACLSFDGVVFKASYPGVVGLTPGTLLGDYRVFAYLAAGLCVALFVGQTWVKPLAPYAWLWAPCFAVVGAGALVVAIIVIPDAVIGVLSTGSRQNLLANGFFLFSSVVGLIAWAPARLYLRTGLRGVREAVRSMRRVVAALAFGLAVLGVPALLNGAAQDFVDRRVDVILEGTREQAIASAQSLRAAFWCDWSCLHRLPRERQLWDLLPEARRGIIADCFRIATGYDIERFFPVCLFC